jgi:hypothetical protein
MRDAAKQSVTIFFVLVLAATAVGAEPVTTVTLAFPDGGMLADPAWRIVVRDDTSTLAAYYRTMRH